MASGDLPADGELRLGPVQLPAGRRVVPWEEPGQPVAWVTRDQVPQPGPVWSALADLHAGTGLVPVLLADDDPDYDFGFMLPCDPAGISQVDPAQLLAPRWDDWMADQAEAARSPRGPWPTPLTTQFLGLEPRPDGGPGLADIVKAIMNVATDPAASAELSRRSGLDLRNAGLPRPGEATQDRAESQPPAVPARPFPGLAPPSDSRLTSAERDRALGALPAARIGLVPAARPADVLAVVGWTAFDDPSYPDDIRNAVWIGAVLRSWEDRFGARLLTIGPGAEIKLLVDRPPRTAEAAGQIAVEHSVFCDECAGKGLGSVPDIAHAILDTPIWTFWWD
jgi:hypothetical protein